MKKIDVYFLPTNSDTRQESLTTISPISAEAHYFKLCKKYILDPGFVIVKSTICMVTDAQFQTGSHIKKRENNEKRYRMIWAPSDEWDKPSPFQMRGLAVAWYGRRLGAQTALATLLGVQTRTWRNWARLINNKKMIPWHAWHLALILTDFHPDIRNNHDD